MTQHARPKIDKKNPMYCPKIPPTVYMEHMRRVRRNNAVQRQHRRHLGNGLVDDFSPYSFSRALENALLEGMNYSDSDGGDDHCRVFPIRSKKSSPQSTFPYLVPRWEREQKHGGGNDGLTNDTLVDVRNRSLHQKSSGSENMRQEHRMPASRIMDEPVMYGKSPLTMKDESFIVTIKPTRLEFLPTPSKPYLLGSDQDSTPGLPDASDLYSDSVHLDPRNVSNRRHDIRTLVEQLDRMIPGSRLKERLLTLSNFSQQGIVDFLAEHGLLSARILSILRMLEVRRVVLTESLQERNGLNLRDANMLAVFSKPMSFSCLSELTLCDTILRDFDLIHITRLPKLSTLLLDSTSISNEAVFLLVPLKGTLTQLSLAANPKIDDDAVPALLLLSKLSFLSILDTGIGMPGLRRLARAIYVQEQVIDIEIPVICGCYVDEMPHKYLVNPVPPLITDPKVCAELSPAALQRNLVAHAQCNPTILTTGGKEEMVGRLKKILETRKMDMLVRDMIFEHDPEDQTCGE